MSPRDIVVSPDPLDRRARLEKEQRNARRAQADASGRRRRLKDEILRDERRLRQAQVHTARRSEVGEDSFAIGEELEQRRQALATAEAEEAAAKAGAVDAADELRSLLNDEFEAFAEIAEEKTQRALALILGMEQEYRRAAEAWEAAQEEWDPLVKAAPHVPVNPANHASNRTRPMLTRAPSFPFPTPQKLFAGLGSGTLAPRPVEIGIEAESEEELETGV